MSEVQVTGKCHKKKERKQKREVQIRSIEILII
jgi:aspartyl/asparaginyl-tRNA synthetase